MSFNCFMSNCCCYLWEIYVENVLVFVCVFVLMGCKVFSVFYEMNKELNYYIKGGNVILYYNRYIFSYSI